VTLCSDPAKVIVAPNSPKHRAAASAVPRPRAEATVGIVIVLSTRHGPAPKAAAVCSNFHDRVRIDDSSAVTRKGNET
jgi:hypothetical protein